MPANHAAFSVPAVHPNDLLATVYYALGIDPNMVIYNHINQPRELVKGKPITDLFVG